MDPEGHAARPDGAGPESRGPDEPLDAEPVLDASSDALLQAFIGISSDLDTRSVLFRILVSACELTGARHGALGVLGHDGLLTEVIPHGMDAAAVDGIRSAHRRGLENAEGTTSEPLRLADVSQHPDFRELAEGDPAMQSLLRVPVRVRGTTFGILFLAREHDGRSFTDHDQLLVQALVNVAGFVMENAHAYTLSERRRRWLELFGELNELLMPPITLAEALERIVDAVRGASDAAGVSMWQVPAGEEPVVMSVAGDIIELDDEERGSFVRAVRRAAESGEVVDLPVRDRVAVFVPLRAHLAIPGVLVASRKWSGDADEFEERELLISFADQAALVLDRTQALEDREQLAVISDRDRIARDLHDVVIQRLFATGLQMQSIRQLATTDELRAKMDQNVRDLDQTIRDIRTTIFELQHRPQSSLRTEVRDLVREYVPVLGFAPSVQMHGDVDKPVDPKLHQQLVAVLREALSNVAQHAEAGSASVDVRVTDTHLRLRVTDNGKGIPDDRVESGIRNARRRAVMLGGSLDLWPGDPTGTAFIWSVPFEQAQAAT
jgi:signal transduction histidine kinase